MWDEMYEKEEKFIFCKWIGKSQYSILRKNTGMELASLTFLFTNDDAVVIDSLIVNKNTPDYRGFEDAHIGTNLLSDALTDMYFRQNFRFREIRGWLSSVDADNGNWLSSIPFYRSFPKYLNPNLPITLTFELSDRRNFVTLIPDSISAEDCRENFKDLYFRYKISE